MLKQSFNSKGFGLAALLVTVMAVVIVGGAGALVYHRNHKPKVTSTASSVKPTSQGQPSTSAQSPVTSAELISVAKQVYSQDYDSADKLPVVGGCGGASIQTCPFTTELASKINGATVPAGAQGPGAILIAGIQNGPFGTLAYSAVPTAQGGNVTVNLTPDPTAGGAALTWQLAIVKSGGKLLVDEIQYSQTANGSRTACGPIEISNYTSCW